MQPLSGFRKASGPLQWLWDKLKTSHVFGYVTSSTPTRLPISFFSLNGTDESTEAGRSFIPVVILRHQLKTTTSVVKSVSA